MSENIAPGFRFTKSVVDSSHGIVTAQHHKAAKIGANVLESGGNAIDAAVATSFAMGVLEPWMSGIGGGGCAVVYDPSNGKIEALDFNMRSSAELDPSFYRIAEGSSNDLFGWPNVECNRNVEGPHSIAIPGLVAGQDRALQRWGTMTLTEALEPAIALAKTGLLVDWYASLVIASSAKSLRQNEHSSAIWLADGLAPNVDFSLSARRITNTNLIGTLEFLGDQGVDGFYRGDLAKRNHSDLNSFGASLSENDLRCFQAEIVDPVEMDRSNVKISSIGGLFGGKTLIDCFELIAFSKSRESSLNGPNYLDLFEAMTSAMQHRITSMGHACDTGCTSHINVIDRNGMAVSWTQTLLSLFGSKVTLPNSGILMNNGIMWFDPRPGNPNSIAPAAQPLANMCPSVAVGDNMTVAAGAAGGRRILPAVFQILHFLIDRDMELEESFLCPRIDVSGGPEVFIDRELPESDKTQLRDAIALREVPHLAYPFAFACPSACCMRGHEQWAMTAPQHPWADAVAAQFAD